MFYKTQAGMQRLHYTLLINTLVPLPPSSQIPQILYDVISLGVIAALHRP